MLRKSYLFFVVAIALICVALFGLSQMSSVNQKVLSIPINQHAIVLPVTIDGKNYRFLLDTGASHTAIDNALAATFSQVTPESQIPFAFRRILDQGIATADGKLHKDHIKLWQAVPIALGKYPIVSADPWLGFDTTLLGEVLGERIDGVLGMDVFRQLSWAVNNVDNTLTVWGQAPSTLDYRQCVPYSDSYGQSPGMEVNVKNEWALFRVDTGARDTIVSGEFLQFLHDSGAQVDRANNNVPSVTASGLGSMESYVVDGLFFNNTAVGRLKVSQSKDVLNIGMNFLSRFEQYLFLPNSMQFCYNADNFTRDEQHSLRNIAVRYRDGRIEVFYNANEEIARYGLQNGDKLLELNGRDAAREKIEDVRRFITDMPVGTLKLLIERDGRQHALVI